MRLSLRSCGLTWLLANQVGLISAIAVNVDDAGSLKAAAKIAADNMMSYYIGDKAGQTPGLLPGPTVDHPAKPNEGYYWWEAGAMWMSLIEYWSLTNDDTYNDKVTQGLLFQVGPDVNFEPPNQTASEGNDDQVFWAFAAMSAAEHKFPDPEAGKPQWLALAQAVFNRQAGRWDAAHCGGGLRWQFNQFNNGYDYKNTISNGGLFQLGARLARYTGNDTYASWAERTLEWIIKAKIVTGSQTEGYKVYDGADVGDDCASPHPAFFSYNYGTFIMGCAYLYDYSNKDAKWLNYLNGFLKGAQIFFPGAGVLTEAQCEKSKTCNNDQQSFKGYLARWMSVAALLVPDVKDDILAKLKTSALAAGKSCVGGNDGKTCGLVWSGNNYDGLTGVGQEMSAMQVFANNLINLEGPLNGGKNDNGHGTPIAPLTAKTGGTSSGDPSAGSNPTVVLDPALTRKITAGDKAGAGILTTLVLAGTAYLAYFVVLAKDTYAPTFMI